jgi:hypothetical protein
MTTATRYADFSGTYVYALTNERVTVAPNYDYSYRWDITFPDGDTQTVSSPSLGLLISSRLLEKEATP